MTDEVVGRNRRRIALVTAASLLNHWLSIATLLAIPATLLVHAASRDDDPGRSPATVLVLVGLGATPVAALWVSEVTATVRRHVVRAGGGLEVGPDELPRVHDLLAELAIATGTPPVAVALVDDPAPNAMAVGRRPRDTTVVVTTGLVEKLTRDELAAVLAVEVCAIRRLDTALRSVTMASTAGAFQIHNMLRGDVAPGRPWYQRWDWSAWLAILLTWPTMLFAALLRRWAQRWSDFGADDMAVAVTRHPAALISALRTIETDHTALKPLDAGVPLPWLPPMAPDWIKPVPNDGAAVPYEVRSLMTRPDLRQRIDRLDRPATARPHPATAPPNPPG